MAFSSCYWVYDVFPSFSGKDVRRTLMSHFFKEFDLKSIKTFKDIEIKSGLSLDPELKQAIMTSKIAIVVLSVNYASSSYCLDELMEIMKYRKYFGQIVIPIFYDLDPCHVRHRTGKFGEAFDKTCQRKTEKQTTLWCQALKDIASIRGYHAHNCPSEAKMIEELANDVLRKLNITPPKDLEDFVGMEEDFGKNEKVVLLADDCTSLTIQDLFDRKPHFDSSVTIQELFDSKPHFDGSLTIQDLFDSKLHFAGPLTIQDLLDSKPHFAGSLTIQDLIDSKPHFGGSLTIQDLLDSKPHFGGALTIQELFDSKPHFAGSLTIQELFDSKPHFAGSLTIQDLFDSEPHFGGYLGRRWIRQQ